MSRNLTLEYCICDAGHTSKKPGQSGKQDCTPHDKTASSNPRTEAFSCKAEHVSTLIHNYRVTGRSLHTYTGSLPEQASKPVCVSRHQLSGQQKRKIAPAGRHSPCPFGEHSRSFKLDVRASTYRQQHDSKESLEVKKRRHAAEFSYGRLDPTFATYKISARCKTMFVAQAERH